MSDPLTAGFDQYREMAADTIVSIGLEKTEHLFGEIARRIAIEEKGSQEHLLLAMAQYGLTVAAMDAGNKMGHIDAEA